MLTNTSGNTQSFTFKLDTALTAAGGLMFNSNGAALMAIDRSAVRVASLIPAIGGGWDSAVISVDSSSYIAIGSTGTATIGALTIENGVTANLAGAIDGNLVVNGILNVVGTLAVSSFGAAAPAISGTGTPCDDVVLNVPRVAGGLGGGGG